MRVVSLLTSICIVLSVALLINVFGIQGGLGRKLDRAVETAGGDNFETRLTGPAMEVQGVSLLGAVDQFPLTALDEVRQIPSVAGASAESFGVSSPSQSLDGKLVQQAVTFVGVTPGYFGVRNWPLTEGRAFSELDFQEGREVAVVTPQALQGAPGIGPVSLGGHIRVPGVGEYEVIGVLPSFDEQKAANETGSVATPMTGFRSPSSIRLYVPISALPQTLLTDPRLNLRKGYRLWVSARPGQLEKAIAEVTTALQKYETDQIKLVVVPDHVSQVVHVRVRDSVARSLFVAVLLSVLVGLVNLANAVLFNVLAHTRELGVRKALGATRMRIAFEQVWGSLTLALPASLLGLGLGMILRPAMARLFSETLVVSLGGVAAASGTLLVGTLLAAAYPARLASRQDPASLMRQSVAWKPRRGAGDARTVLAILAVALGSFGITMILANSAKTQMAINEYMRAAGESTVIVRDQDVFGGQPGGAPAMRVSAEMLPLALQAQSVRGGAWTETVSGVTLRAGEASQVAVTSGVPTGGSGSPDDANAIGALTAVLGDLFGVKHLQLQAGRALDPGDSGGQVCVLGATFAKTLFGKPEAAIGKEVTIEDERFVVKGVLQPRPPGVTDLDADRDKTVFIPSGSEAHLFGAWAKGSRKGLLTLEAMSSGATADAVKEVRDILAQAYPGRQPPAVTRPLGELKELLATKERLGYVFLLLGLLASVIGAVGIANLMMVRVVERTRDIGIHQVCGATRADIVRLNLNQAFALCGIGSALGYVTAEVAAAWLIAGPPLGLGRIATHLAAVGVLAAVMGLAGGIYPALQASRNRPRELMQQW